MKAYGDVAVVYRRCDYAHLPNFADRGGANLDIYSESPPLADCVAAEPLEASPGVLRIVRKRLLS